MEHKDSYSGTQDLFLYNKFLDSRDQPLGLKILEGSSGQTGQPNSLKAGSAISSDFGLFLRGMYTFSK
ncbi:hypothetical protein [Alkalibaculum sporogenes]|uniref:hypothetical protein n=1 Tax=Alkalibaculum sporogenes TaxID=2655001 RepID=UPI00187B5978|nr:hypothetical protein [Alkalibaculum sporogenes]